MGSVGILLTVICLVLSAQHQTAQLDNPANLLSTPYVLELRQVEWDNVVPTLHSYAAAQHNGLWLLLAGRTSGLHGLTGRNAFDPAFENREVWVIDPVSRKTWSKSLESTAAGSLSTDLIDSLSCVNTQFIQTGEYLLVTGGYGYRRSIANHTTYATLTVIDVPAMIAWVQAVPGTKSSSAADHIQQIQDAFFKVTGGGLERIGDEYQLIFGQNYEGAYRPFLNGIYTQQVRRFKISSYQPLSVTAGSKLTTVPNPDFRRRDLNVQPLLERQQTAPFDLIEKAMVLGGVFTLEGGSWTLPVIIGADGEISQQTSDAEGTLHQSVQTYHCAKILLFHSISEEMHTVLLGGISLRYWDPISQQYVTDENLPFVNDVTAVVRYANGSIQHFRLPLAFLEVPAPWDGSKSLRFGTNAEFFAAPDTPMLTAKIMDLAAIHQPQRIGWMHGGIIADAPNSGNTAASGFIFEVWLHPQLPPIEQSVNLAIAAHQNALNLHWTGGSTLAKQLQFSPDLLQWNQTASFFDINQKNGFEIPETSTGFFRMVSSIKTAPSE